MTRKVGEPTSTEHNQGFLEEEEEGGAIVLLLVTQG